MEFIINFEVNGTTYSCYFFSDSQQYIMDLRVTHSGVETLIPCSYDINGNGVSAFFRMEEGDSLAIHSPSRVAGIVSKGTYTATSGALVASDEVNMFNVVLQLL